MELRPIRVFLEVAERRSFASAAKALRMTPASVTRIIARLEADLGQQLLLRTTRRVSLTSIGARVAARYRPLLAEFDQTAEDLAAEAHPKRGRLVINAPLSFGMRLMPGLLNSFRLAYPNVAVTLSLTDRLVDILQEGVDLAIRISVPPTDKSTIWRKICTIPRLATAAPALLDRIPVPQDPDDLPRPFCLSYGEAVPERWLFTNGAQSRSVVAGGEVISNNGDVLAGMLRGGAGIAVLPEFLVADDLRDGRLIRLMPHWEAAPLWLSLYYPPYETLPPLVATFTEFFEAYLKEAEGFDFHPPV